MKASALLIVLFLPASIFAQTRKLKVEPNHSTIGFRISIAGFTEVTGKFTDFEVLIDWNENAIDSMQLSAVLQVRSINTGIPDRDNHLRTADFFDVDKYPEITFQSDSVRRLDDSHFEAYGKFSMHGITKKFVLPFEVVKIENNTVGISSRTTLNRLEYGVGNNFKHSTIPNFLSDDIQVEINCWTRKRN